MPTIKTKRKRYFKAREIEDKTQKEALERGGFPVKDKHGSRIEKSRAYAKLKESYADALKEKITLEEIADEHIKNITQDKDRGAKNTAIKMSIDRIDPLEQGEIDTGDVQIVIKKK